MTSEPSGQPQNAAEIRRTLWKGELLDWVETLTIAVTIAMVTLLFFVQIVIVDGDSMNPTLFDTERLLISTSLYGIDRGDIVVIHRDNDEPIVKRVIATEGQTVDIDFVKGEVYVDGQLQQEDYIFEPTYNSGGALGVSFPVTVPKDCVFVLGDNRNHSLDSRYQEIGMVPTDHIFGEVLCRIYPFWGVHKL